MILLNPVCRTRFSIHNYYPTPGSRTPPWRSYMHSIGLVHGDIKCSNVLVSTCGSVKLADFGTSTFDPGTGGNVAGTFR